VPWSKDKKHKQKSVGLRDSRPWAGAGWGLSRCLTSSSSFPREGIAQPLAL